METGRKLGQVNGHFMPIDSPLRLARRLNA